MNTKKILMIGGGVVLALLLVVGGVFAANSILEATAPLPSDIIAGELESINGGQTSVLEFDGNAVLGGWEQLSEEEIQAALNNRVQEGLINISMNTSPYFATGDSEGNLMIVNEYINNYPQRVEIKRNDTGELIYSSKAIAVGSKIEAAKLDVVLPAGEYECTAMFHSLDPATGNIMGSAGAIIHITVAE